METAIGELRHHDVRPSGAYWARGGCYNCGRERDVIAFPTSVEGEGQIVFCRRCVTLAANLIGLVPDDELPKVASERNFLRAELNEQRNLNRALHETVSAYSAIVLDTLPGD